MGRFLHNALQTNIVRYRYFYIQNDIVAQPKFRHQMVSNRAIFYENLEIRINISFKATSKVKFLFTE